MSLYYDLFETPVPDGEEKKPMHARVCSKGTISAKMFLDQVAKEQHMPHAMVVGIVQALSTTMADWLAAGYAVELDEFGYFSTTLKCARPVADKKGVRAESIRLGTVKFRPSKEFKQYIASKAELKRADKRFFPDKLKAVGDVDVRKRKLMEFIEANICINRAEYARLVHVTDRCASRDLQGYLAAGVIRKRGAGRSVVYVKA